MLQVLLYVDPGSGSYLIQMIIASILGALFYMKSIWAQVKSFFGTRKGPKSSKPIDGHD